MPTYRVEVLARDGSTAQPLTLEAPDPDAARAIASDQGWIVGKAEQIVPEMANRPAAPTTENKNDGIPYDDDAILPSASALFKGLSEFAVLYGIIAIIGLVTTLIGLGMSTGSGSTHNIGMIHNRQVTILIGCTLFVCGLLGGVGCQISMAVRSLSERLDRQSADD